MVDFRKWFPALAVAAMFAATANAQITPSLSCVSNAGTTPLVRSQGLAELVGDVVLNCTGGVPTPAGQTVPQVNIQVFLNTNITSRLVADPLSEALILIDDPAPANQIPCVPTSGTSCAVTGTGAGTGVNFKSGGVPNVWQGRNGGANSVLWLGVPIDPPGTNGTRTIRITNVRANANALGTSSTLIPTQIQMFISITPPQSLPLNNPQQTVAFVANGLSFNLRKPDNSDSLASGGQTYLQCVSNNSSAFGDSTKAFSTSSSSSGFGGTQATAAFVARFREGFASAFKRRNIAVATTTGGAIDVNSAPTPVAQDAPGGVCSSGTPLANTALQCPANNYFTETGFYNPAFTSTSGLNKAGLADTGTRLMLRFANVPAGLIPFVPTVDSTGKARLVSTDANGAGAFSAVSATNSNGYAPVTITNGAGAVVYEVMSSDPLATDDILVPVVVAYTANTGASPALPALGTATVSGSFAPLSTVTTQSASAPLPRFADSPTTANAFILNPCSTNLLFPFVTNQAGFDTGVAISNTSLDPFGTSTQQGSCTMYYYGNTNGGAAPAAATSPAVPAGTTLVFLLSSGGSGVAATPGFQGYMIARCAFQYAHGFAFISDVGANKIAEGYLALVLDGSLGSRTGFVSEVLAH